MPVVFFNSLMLKNVSFVKSKDHQVGANNSNTLIQKLTVISPAKCLLSSLAKSVRKLTSSHKFY